MSRQTFLMPTSPDVVPFFEPRVKVSASYGTTNVDLGTRISTLRMLLGEDASRKDQLN